jgi:hypothetical protein
LLRVHGLYPGQSAAQGRIAILIHHFDPLGVTIYEGKVGAAIIDERPLNNCVPS